MLNKTLGTKVTTETHEKMHKISANRGYENISAFLKDIYQAIIEMEESSSNASSSTMNNTTISMNIPKIKNLFAQEESNPPNPSGIPEKKITYQTLDGNSIKAAQTGQQFISLVLFAYLLLSKSCNSDSGKTIHP